MPKPTTKPVLVSLSFDASDDPALGHYYWNYRFLFEKQATMGSPWGKTIGPSNARADFILPLLKKSKSKRFALTLGSLLPSPWGRLRRKLSNLVASGMTHLQIYDGDIVELLLAWVVSFRFPGIQVIYNFHWPIEWIELLSRGGLSAHLARNEIFRIVRDSPDNLTFTAETTSFGSYLTDNLGAPILTYPIFATFEISRPKPWDLRLYDVLIMPQRPAELEFAQNLVDQAKEAGLSTVVFVKPETWEAAVSRGVSASSRIGNLILAPLSSEGYVGLLNESRTVVLPYQKDYFSWGSSGKFNEAIVAKAFPFAPESSAVCSQSALGAGAHGFPWDVEQTLEKVTNRLQKGFPSNLHPVTFDTLLKWLPQDSGAENRPSKGREARAFAALLVLFLYRPHANSRRSLSIRGIGRFLEAIRSQLKAPIPKSKGGGTR